MQSKEMGPGRSRRFVLVMETGDDVHKSLMQFAGEQEVSAAYFSAIGAFSSATLAWFSLDKKEYEHIPVNEQVEVVSLTGNITLYQGERRLHIHAVLGKRDGAAVGGHLIQATVRPTLEVVVFELASPVERQMVDEVGLPLIRFS